MKHLFLICMLLVPVATAAQDAKVLALDEQDAKDAAALYQQLHDVQAKIGQLHDRITTKYLTVEKSGPGFVSSVCFKSVSGVAEYAPCSEDPKTPKTHKEVRDGWLDFVYSADFKFIVPKPYEAPSSASYSCINPVFTTK
jgi:hypothetical protein